MKVIELNIEVDQAFGNLHRDRCVLIAVKDKDDKLLSGAKPGFFPPTITRLLGGGLDKGERPEAAAIRELSEELGVELSVEDLEPIAKFITNAVDRDGKEYKNETYLYGAKLKNIDQEMMLNRSLLSAKTRPYNWLIRLRVCPLVYGI